MQPVGERSALHTLGFREPRSGSAGPLHFFFPSPVLICLAGDVTFLGGTCRSAEWELGEISKQNKTEAQSERREGTGFVAGTLLSKDGDYGRLRPSLVIPLFLPFGTFLRFSLQIVTTKCFPAESGEDTVSFWRVSAVSPLPRRQTSSLTGFPSSFASNQLDALNLLFPPASPSQSGRVKWKSRL